MTANFKNSDLNLPPHILGTHDGAVWHWHLKRNISISPGHLALIFAGISALTLLIGFVFFWLGASLILPFSMIEIAALVIAYLYIAVHANDYEKLMLSDELVQIERKIGFKLHQVQLLRSMTRVDKTKLTNGLIEIRQGKQSTHFGQFAHLNLRLPLAHQISGRLLPPLN